MDDELTKIEQAAANLAARDGSLEAIEKAASAIKSVSEARRAAVEVGRERWTRINTVFSGLAPLAAMAAVVVTVFVSFQNIREERWKEEAADWREFLNSIQGAKGRSYSDTTVGPRLASFFASEQLRQKAVGIATRILGQISDIGEFKELYGDIFKVVDNSNIQSLIDVEKTLVITEASLERKCYTDSYKYTIPEFAQFQGGLCSTWIHDSKLMEITNNSPPQDIYELREERSSLLEEQVFMSERIAAYFRGVRHDNKSVSYNNHFDLSDTSFVNADLSNVDLSDANISRAVFTGSELKGTIISSVEYQGVAFGGSDWWEAKYIKAGLLKYLVQYYYPYYYGYERFFGDRDYSRREYEVDVSRLCKAAAIECPPANSLQFGIPTADEPWNTAAKKASEAPSPSK